MSKPAALLALLLLSSMLFAAQFAAPERDALAEPFRGVTTGGQVQAGLFRVQSTGVSTAPVKAAAEAFLAGLTPAQRQGTLFPVDDDEWRKWANVHRYSRQGVGFGDMDARQRGLAFSLLQASLSAKGLKITRDIMQLNETLAELTQRPEEYGEFLYWITVMGTPSATEPWGWQLDGHHLVINYFVLGDQVVMTPTFMGSEPVFAESGKYKGTRILEEHRARGLALIDSLTAAQREIAIIERTKTANRNQTEMFRDNVAIPYAGVRASNLNARQRTLLLDLIGEYVGNMPEGHARIRMSEVRAHLEETYFAWMGSTDRDSAFYYRVHSPVILIELDHQTPVAIPGERVPNRNHIHTVVRTPNGNDYGKDLLRQHLEQHRHDAAHGHDH
jgi:hypothetical protein